MVDFDNFRESAHRIETLPIYTVEEEREDFARFLSGGPLPAFDDDEWLSSISKWSGEGKEISRVRIVDEELSNYEKWEFQCYHYNVASGERILVIPRRTYLELTPPSLRGDYWILDNTTALKMIYEDNGKFIDRVVIDDAESVGDLVEIYSQLSSKAKGTYELVTKQINLAPVRVSFK